MTERVTVSMDREEFAEFRRMVESRVNQCEAVRVRVATDDCFVMHDEGFEECCARWERAGRVSRRMMAQVIDIGWATGWDERVAM